MIDCSTIPVVAQIAAFVQSLPRHTRLLSVAWTLLFWLAHAGV